MRIAKPAFATSPIAGTIARAGRAIASWTVGAALVAGSPTIADAATQGAVGATSTGSIAITATVPNRAQITGLTDVTFANADPTLTATATQNDCVWSNTATKGYTITATGSGAANAFTIANGVATVPYSVQWAAVSGQSTGTPLLSTVPSLGLLSSATRPGCTAGPTSTSSLIVSIASSDLQTMVGSATYTGTLTLVVAPQ